MKEKKILTSPIDLVTRVLELKPGVVNKDSVMGETPNWDSLNHVAIIVEMEKCYDISIPDNEVEKYETMKAIIEVYNRQSGNANSGNAVVEFFKKIPIVKIFFK